MQKLVKSFSAGSALINLGLNFDLMGRKYMQRYVKIAARMLDQLPVVVLYEDDQGPARPIFSGRPDPERDTITVRWRNDTIDVPTFKYYSNDLERWVYSIVIPYLEDADAETVFRAIQALCPTMPVKREKDTVYLERTYMPNPGCPYFRRV